MSDRTVVGWDGSDQAGLALQWAVKRAESEHDGIILVDIEDSTQPIPGEVITDEMVTKRRRAAEAEAERLRQDHPDLRVTAYTRAGDRVEELRRFSRPDNLLVVGTKQRRGPRFRYHWSLGARLAASAPGAVAIIPDLPVDGRSRVVVGIDGTEVSLKSARFAAREARRLGHELVVVHAWLDPLVGNPDVRVEVPFLGELEDEHRLLLESALHSLRSSNPDLTITPILTREEAHFALNSAASSASLLVVGAKQIRGIERFLLGSVSHAVVLDIEVPTIVVGAEFLI